MPGRLPHVERFAGALLFSDISGFTALTERLQARGREGAEEITDVVRESFRAAIEGIERQGGSIVSFGGDALFAIFPGQRAVGCALSAAEEIRAHFASAPEVSTSAGRVALGVSQAIHHGTVVAMHLGRDDRRLHLVGGTAVSALARLEARATAGTILLSRAARVERAREGAGAATPGPAAVEAPDELLARYVPRHVAELAPHFEGEFRHAVMMFLETRGARVAQMQAFVELLWRVLDEHDGLLVSTDLSAAGTKWLCVFGAPRAHEDDPDRAARAALALMGGLPRGLAVRGGFHAGTLANIWMGGATRRSYQLMGDVTNTAARALGTAAWGEVVTTEATRALVSTVASAPRGSFAVKGKAEPLVLHALIAGPAAPRSAVMQKRVMAPMIGRDAELRAIAAALERAKAGQGSAIGIKGEAGLGKSRLKWEASMLASRMGFDVREGRAVSFGGMAYRAIGELLRRSIGLGETAPEVEVLAGVAEASQELALSSTDMHHLADVLGARFAGSPLVHLDGNSIRRNNMIAILALCRGMAQRRPMLLCLEDMHWADEMTREAAEWLVRGASDIPMVVLLISRPGAPAGVPSAPTGYEVPSGARVMELDELRDDAVAELVRAHLGPVPGKVGEMIRDRAEGNPFYVEEVVRHLLESGILALSDDGYVVVRELRADDLPASIETLIAVRLDRLAAEVKRVAQLGAVIGRSFLFSLLRQLDEAHAGSGVAELQARELVFEKTPRPLEYIYKHALTRDVAYASILAARRRELHRAVADALEAQLPLQEREAHLAMLGHHHEHAGQAEKARQCYLQAATAARKRHANEETERLYRAYLRLVPTPTPESIKARNELASMVLQVRGQMKDAEAEHSLALLEARRTGDRIGEGEALLGLGLVHEHLGAMEEARPLLEESLAIARGVGDRRGEGQVLSGLAKLHRDLGRMEETRSLLAQMLAIHRELGDRGNEGLTLGNLGLLNMEQGRMEEARALCEQALAIDRETGQRRLEAAVLCNLANLHIYQGRLDEGRSLHEQALEIAREVGDRRIEANVLGNLANLHREHGRMEEARVLYERALGIHRDVRHLGGEGIVLCALAILHKGQGRMEEARALLEQALGIHRKGGDRRFVGMALGDLADLHQHEGRMEEARALLEQALQAHGEVGNLASEGVDLGRLAGWENLATGDRGRAIELTEQAMALLAGVGDRDQLGRLHCIRGHVALSGGEDAAGSLERARALAAELATGSDLARAIARLERAQARFESGALLICGHAPEDVTAGQLRWLRDHRPDLLPPR